MDSSVPKVSCRNFRANLWRPHTCTNCYKSKSLHQLQQTEPTPSKSLFKKLTSSPKAKKKELRQVASIATLSGDRERRSEWEDMPQRSHKNGPMVGVVKPYAVVDIDEDSETEGRFIAASRPFRDTLKYAIAVRPELRCVYLFLTAPSFCPYSNLSMTCMLYRDNKISFCILRGIQFGQI